MVDEALWKRVTDNATFSSLAGTRLYPFDGIPQNPTYPLATMQLVSETATHLSGADAKEVRQRWTFEGRAEAKLKAIEVDGAIMSALSRQGFTEMGVTVEQCFIEGASDHFNSEPEPGHFRRRRDYFVWFWRS